MDDLPASSAKTTTGACDCLKSVEIGFPTKLLCNLRLHISRASDTQKRDLGVNPRYKLARNMKLDELL